MFYVTGLVILQVVVFDFNLFYFLFGFDPPVGSLLFWFFFIITPLGLYMGVGWVGWKREKKLPAPARISG